MLLYTWGLTTQSCAWKIVFVKAMQLRGDF